MAMPRLIIPVLAMSALITVTDALLSDTKAAPEPTRATVQGIEPVQSFASNDDIGLTRRGT